MTLANPLPCPTSPKYPKLCTNYNNILWTMVATSTSRARFHLHKRRWHNPFLPHSSLSTLGMVSILRFYSHSQSCSAHFLPLLCCQFTLQITFVAAPLATRRKEYIILISGLATWICKRTKYVRILDVYVCVCVCEGVSGQVRDSPKHNYLHIDHPNNVQYVNHELQFIQYKFDFEFKKRIPWQTNK